MNILFTFAAFCSFGLLLGSIHHQCPRSWGSVLSTCAFNLCNHTAEIQTSCPKDKGSQPGICCKTRCGGHNCFYPSTTRQEPSHCPRNWMSDLMICDRNTCSLSDSFSCQKSGQMGFCCPTACGGQNCYYPPSFSQSVHHSILSLGPTCPSKEWMGTYPKRCSEPLCSKDRDCFLAGIVGHCCNTSCGGSSCVFSTKLSGACPVAWNGRSNFTCGIDLCIDNVQCVKNGVKGQCCSTSCKGHNCYFAKQPTPQPVLLSTTGSTLQPSSCPQNWGGVHHNACGNSLCDDDNFCSKEGQNGSCCYTSCGGRNCYYNTIGYSSGAPQPTKQSALFKQPNYDILVLQKRPSTASVQRNELCPDPKIWLGSGSLCTSTTCSIGTSCSWRSFPGLCCPTKCGGLSCFVPHLSPHKPLYSEPCPFRWLGVRGHCGRKRCDRSSDCEKKGKLGHCCRTVCGGKNCRF